MAGLARAQKRFKEQTSLSMASMSTLMLYASTEMQNASKALVRALGDGLAEMSRYKAGSPEVVEAQQRVGPTFGDAFLAWRNAAQADLAGSRKR
jgi:hypothetical protein